MVSWREHLAADPQICGGQFCAKGTRIPVTVTLDNFAEGATRDEIPKAYPALHEEHLDAADLAREESLIPLLAG